MSNEFLHNQELGLIGRLILDPDLIDQCGLAPEHFYNKYCGEVYGSILHLSATKNSVSEVDIVAYLSDGNKEAENHWWSFVGKTAADAVSTETITSVSDFIRTEYGKRQTALICSEAAAAVQEANDAGNIIEATVQKLEEIQTLGKADRPTQAQEAKSLLADLSQLGEIDTAGLPSGVGLEEVVPGGIPRDKVTVLFGETGTFKTTLKSNIIDSIAKSGGLVLDFSLEDSNSLTLYRALARLSNVPYARFATSNFRECDLQNLKRVTNEDIAHLKRIITIGDIPPSADEIIRVARQYKRQGLQAVVIDYITLLDWGRNSERQMLNDAMLKFQRAAKRDGVAYIVVSQLNDERLHERGRADARPILRDLFGSSSLRTACKLAVATYRPGKYGPPRSKYDQEIYGELYSTDPDKYNNIIELWVRKNVLGEDNVPVYVLCDRKTGKMVPYELGEPSNDF